MTTNNNPPSVQDSFLCSIATNVPVTIFLVNGIKLRGVITEFDNFSLLLCRDKRTQLIYKHAVATVMPDAPLTQGDDGEDHQHT